MQNVDAGIVNARNQNRLSGYAGMAGIEGNRLAAQMQGDIFNAGEARLANQFDVGNTLDASKFNSTQAFEGNQFDIGNETDVSKFNAGQGNQMGQFNADLNYRGQVYNADAMARAQAANNAAGEAAAGRAAAASSENTANRLRALGGATSLYGATPGMSNTFGSQLLSGVGMGGQFGQGMVNASIPGNQLPGQFQQNMGNINAIGNLVSQGAGAVYPWLNNNNQNRNQPYNPYGQNNQVARPQVDYPVGPIDMGGWG